MAQFSCRVGTASGSLQTVEVEEESAETARRSLEAKGYFVFDVGATGRSRVRPRLPFLGPGRIGAQALLVFNQELLALTKAGLPILTALDILSERSQQSRLVAILADVREAVKGGM